MIYYDNIGATYLAVNPVFHFCMKHLALDYHFVNQFVQSGQLRVTHITSDDQLADALTNSYLVDSFKLFLSRSD